MTSDTYNPWRGSSLEPGLGEGQVSATYFGWNAPAQAEAQAAVVIPTIGRPRLAEALICVFRQELSGLVQILVGVDTGGEVPESLMQVVRRRPERCSVQVVHLPYSTSERHGGPHPAMDGGALRTILTYMANSRYVAYLDDDNRWTPSHLRLLRSAIQNKAFAFSRRMLVDETTRQPIATDIWDSVGPRAGRFASVGGFVDPSCLMVNKLAVGPLIGRWAETASGSVEPSADSWFFRSLVEMPFGDTGEVTVHYAVRDTNVLRTIAMLKLDPDEATRRYPALVVRTKRQLDG